MGYERNDRRDEREYRGGYGDPRDRGFFERAGDEVRSWFGDEEAERRRRYDERYDERFDRGEGRYGAGRSGLGADDRYAAGGGYRSEPRSNRDEGYRRGEYSGAGRPYAAPYGQPEAGRQFDDDGAIGGSGYRVDGFGYEGDAARRRALYRAAYERDSRSMAAERGRGAEHGDYHDWRDRQLSAFDRDYDEYRRENRSRFESEFATWRQNRQTQRDALSGVKEHQEVVGSDGAHVGKVDHVRGDHILLAKTDRDAGGHHHTIPSSWIASVGDTVMLSRTAEEAKRQWTDSEGRGGLFGRDDDDGRTTGGNLNRSFSGTY